MMESSNKVPGGDELIVARSTAAGAGAIAIVRVDGAGVRDLVGKLFKPHGGRGPADFPREAIFGRWMAPGGEGEGELEVIDEGLTIFFAAPRSFTGNDLAEFHCHGGGAVVRRLIGAAVGLGARPAEPGEFTRRAFLNGRIDLAQAEAVADLIRAETDGAARAAQAQLAGGISRRITALREGLIDLAAEIEARIDFPEEGIEPAARERLDAAFDAIGEGLAELLATRRRGRLLREGARVALVGPPNVGKSSLLNALARADRAIVTPHPGTTRDTIECTVDIQGIAVTLVDTAGLRDATEPIEKIGIERTREAIEQADLVVEVRDASNRSDGGAMATDAERRSDLIAENKIDLLDGGAGASETQVGGAEAVERVRVSALTGEGIDRLEASIAAGLLGENQSPAGGATGDSASVSERHAAGLDRAVGSLAEALGAWEGDLGTELVMIDLREALAALDDILGLAAGEAILDRVFEKFCLGK